MPTHNANCPPPKHLLLLALQTFTSVDSALHQGFLGPGEPDSLDLTLILRGLRVSKLDTSPLTKN